MNISKSKYVIVIDHREARIYKVVQAPTQPHTVIRLEPHGARRYLHNVGDEDNGQRKPECEHFYKQVIDALSDAHQILIYGHASGSSSAMNHLIDDMNHNAPQLADRIVGHQIVDVVHLTPAQLLAKARDFFDTLNKAATATTRA